MGSTSVVAKLKAESLENVAIEIEEAAGLLRVQAERMRRKGVEEITVQKGYSVMVLGMKSIVNFSDYAKSAITDARDAKGDYGVIERGDPASPIKRRRRKKAEK